MLSVGFGESSDASCESVLGWEEDLTLAEAQFLHL